MLKIFRSKIFIHTTFWVISFVILYRLFTIDYNNGKTDVIYTLVFHIPLFFVVYVNYYLINNLIKNKRYLLYLILVIAVFATGVGLHYLLFDHIVDFVFPDYFFISMYSIWEISQYVFAYVIVSLLFKLSKDWFDLKDQQMQLKDENHKVQLSNLKAQLNPHFLFNSLNNIYSMSSTDSKKGREHIVKLSDALRYMLYKTDEERVPLKNEIEYFRNYIELERVRLEEHADVNISLPETTGDLKIAPLILLPFIENCFKHCNKANPFIEISLDVEGKQLIMNCKNNKANSKGNEDSGVGLNNANKRLELIYPDYYKLDIEDRTDYYSIELNLILNE